MIIYMTTHTYVHFSCLGIEYEFHPDDYESESNGIIEQLQAIATGLA